MASSAAWRAMFAAARRAKSSSHLPVVSLQPLFSHAAVDVWTPTYVTAVELLDEARAKTEEVFGWDQDVSTLSAEKQDEILRVTRSIRSSAESAPTLRRPTRSPRVTLNASGTSMSSLSLRMACRTAERVRRASPLRLAEARPRIYSQNAPARNGVCRLLGRLCAQGDGEVSRCRRASRRDHAARRSARGAEG